MPVAAFLSYIFLTAFTPGPNTIMAMTGAIHAGFRASMRFCWGVLLGFLIVMSSCALFTSLLYAFLPGMEPWLRRAGALYIALLAYSVFRRRPSEAAGSGGSAGSAGSGGPGGSDGSEGSGATAKAVAGLWSGMLLQCVNVKVILYGLTAFSTFVLPHFHAPAEAAFFVLVLSLVGFAGTVCWALFGSLFQRLFLSHAGVVNAVLAALLLYCALSLVMAS